MAAGPPGSQVALAVWRCGMHFLWFGLWGPRRIPFLSLVEGFSVGGVRGGSHS